MWGFGNPVQAAAAPKQNTPEAQGDAWQSHLSGRHDGVAADVNRLRAEMKTMIEAQKLGIEDRLRNLERLSDVQGRALTDILSGGVSARSPKSGYSGGDSGADQGAENLRTHVDQTDQRMSSLYTEVAQMRAEIEGFRGSSLNGKDRDEMIMSLNFISMERYERDLQTITVDRDLAMCKAGYLAVALTESSQAEKSAMFAKLQQKEQMLLDTRPNSLQPIPDLNSGTNPNNPFQALTNAPAQAQPDVEENRSFTIEVNASNAQKLGATVNSRDGQTLVVEKIGEGLIRAWNTDNFQNAVKVGDLIVAVNGESNGVEAIQHELQQCARLRITLRRLNRTHQPTTVRV